VNSIAIAHTTPFDFWVWFGNNWWWVIWVVIIFGGGLLETLTDGLSDALRIHHKRKMARIKARTAAREGARLERLGKRGHTAHDSVQLSSGSYVVRIYGLVPAEDE
jgi:hypothetical protein